MGKNTYSAFKNDKDREQKGVLLNLGEAGSFTIARAGGANAAFAKKLTALTKPHRKSIQAQTMPENAAQEIMMAVYAETVVLGWDGVTGEDGTALAFNKDNCIKLFKDLPDLYDEIVEAANQQRYFREDIAEGDVKN